MFIDRCQNLLRPGKDVCIDKSMIPFHSSPDTKIFYFKKSINI